MIPSLPIVTVLVSPAAPSAPAAVLAIETPSAPKVIVEPGLPAPVALLIDLILPRFSANFTSRSLSVLTTLMLFVSVAVRVKLSAPLIVKVVPKSRCTFAVVSLPVKSKPLVVSVLVIFVLPSVIFLDKSL